MKVIDNHGFEDVCLQDVKVLSGTRPAGRTTDRRKNGRPFHGLLYLREGEARFWSDCEEFIARPGELIFIPKYFKYKMCYSATPTSFVLVDLSLFNGVGEELTLSEKITTLLSDSTSQRLSPIMTGLEQCGISKDLTVSFRRKELLYLLLGIVYGPGSSILADRQQYPQIVAGTRLLEKHFLENLPISEFAKASNISVSSFRSLFGKQYGISPVQYRNNLRVERARALLSEGSCTVTEAAYACGFENLGYFCRYYKRITGETPSQTKNHGTTV